MSPKWKKCTENDITVAEDAIIVVTISREMASESRVA